MPESTPAVTRPRCADVRTCQTPPHTLLRCGWQPLLMVMCLLVAGHVAAGTALDPILFESSAPGQAGGGLVVSDTHFHGQTFRIDRPVRVTAIGSQFRAFNDTSVYGAVYALGTPVTRPPVVDEATVLATTLLSIPGGNVVGEVYGEIDITLEPGWYSIGFGSGRYGATASGANVTIVPTGNPMASQSYGPYSVHLDTGVSVLQATSPRFIVRGVVTDDRPIDDSAFVFETAAPWAWGGSAFSAINSNHFTGQRFTLTRPTRLDRISVWVAGQPTGATAFAAVVPIATADSYPPPAQPSGLRADGSGQHCTRPAATNRCDRCGFRWR